MRRHIAVSEELDLGSTYRHQDAGGRVSLFLGRDPADRKTNSTWTVDELWLMPVRGRVRGWERGWERDTETETVRARV